MRALLATDGSEASADAIRAGRELLPDGTAWHLVTVIPPMVDPNEDTTGFAGPLIGPEEASTEHVEDVITGDGRLAAAARTLGPEPVDQWVLEGKPGEEICALAAAMPADVVVVGARGGNAVSRALLGSVSSYVVEHAPCAVLVVPSDV